MIVLVILLKIILALLLVLAGLLASFLILPLTYSGEVMFSEGLRANYHFGWPWKLFGIRGFYDDNKHEMGLYLNKKRILKLNLDMEASDLSQEKPEKKEKIRKKAKAKEDAEKKTKKEAGENKKSPSIRSFLNKNFIGIIFQYLKNILLILKPKYLVLSGSYGFEDPSITGILSGVISIINNTVPYAKLQLYPDFTKDGFDIDFKIGGTMTLGSLVYQTVKTVLKKDIRKLIFNFGK